MRLVLHLPHLFRNHPGQGGAVSEKEKAHLSNTVGRYARTPLDVQHRELGHSFKVPRIAGCQRRAGKERGGGNGAIRDFKPVISPQ
ncbi:MAG: hypothetical protein A3H70_01030 [Candidatus Komeilibacteria bacterium RIFCSPLOWO2_02_FULL_48_11]|uniref:Uncharacterized protein n=1 Tax=Candidatus Komeilibacteria bacterium RIFCSPLOWO2_02_FULL_48_11 TaxID=1798553 RepID=A0A1G2BUG4_9BACT|nr:MAG: hypothetical protein A3H70_01030 [Candidatus Komeilibacteria bacterium RIFCSPLOWO2_02_FULL_48_11]